MGVMERAESTGDILQRILAAEAGAVVLRGPAACGKTAAALEFYRHFTNERIGGCLLLVPNAPAVAALRRKLLDQSPRGVIVAPQVLTFAALAARILPKAGITAGAMTAPQRDLLLRRIVDELAGEGGLAALASVADTPGLVAALDRAISDLKRAAVEPEALAAAINGRKGKHRDLLEVYRRYQQSLHERGAYDLEGRMWQARDYLAAGGDAPLAGAAAVAVDGFTDFTPTQLEILTLLAPHLKRILITLPFDENGPERMWHWTRRTLNNIRKAFGQELEEIAMEAAGGDSLARLWENLFNVDAPRIEPPGGLHVIAAAGAEAEVAAVAPRVKRLLADGAAAGGIAVLARSLDEYRQPLERIFAEQDIPLAAAPRALTDEPIVRFLLDAASLAPEFAFRDVLRVIKNSYFRPRALGDFDGAAVAAAEMLIREGNVLEGREAYAAAAKRLAQRRAPSDDGDDDRAIALGPLVWSPEFLGRAAVMLEKLFDVSQLPGPGIEIPGLLEMCGALELEQAACAHDEADLVARDLRALAALRQTLEQLDGPPASLAHLREALRAAFLPPPRGQSLVDVLDVLDARSLRYRHVFLVGLGEGQFPARVTDGPLLGEADRLAWADRGVVLDNRSDLTAREMLLFYLAVSRADDSLTVSYQHSDAAGHIAAPGAFLMSLVETFGGMGRAQEAGMVAKVPPGRFVPAEDDLASPRDALSAALAGLFGAGGGCPSALCWAAENAADKIEAAAIGLWAHHRRWRAGACDSFDGRITHPALRDKLEQQFGVDAVFSASRFNTFGQCPWSFFASYVLGLKELTIPQRRLEAVSRGIFCHGVLFRLMVNLRELSQDVVSLGGIPETDLIAALDSAVQAEAQAVESHQVLFPKLWQIQRDQIHRQLRDYLLGARRGDRLNREGLHFELGFGMADAEPASLDPASRAEPVAVATPAGTVRVRGRIDRVDRIRFEDRRGLMVIDYKTGRLPAGADILAGRSVQLPLYAAVVAQMLGEGCLGGAFHRIGPARSAYERLFAAVSRHGGRYKLSDRYEADLAAAIEHVGRFVQAMRAGRFDLMPTHQCPSYCPFRRICHFSQARLDLKAAGREAPT